MNFYSFGIVITLSLLAVACEDTNQNEPEKELFEVEKDKIEDKEVTDSEEDQAEQIIEEQTKQTVNSVNPKIKTASKVISSTTKKQASTKKQVVEEKKEVIPTKWKNTYTQDKKWMELYESSRTFFLNGWESEFDSNPDASISRDELLLAYRKRMENIFYETPSFIEFCVQEMKVSAEFELFCQKWKENVN